MRVRRGAVVGWMDKAQAHAPVRRDGRDVRDPGCGWRAMHGPVARRTGRGTPDDPDLQSLAAWRRPPARAGSARPDLVSASCVACTPM